MIGDWISFLGVSAVVIVVPGPDTVLTIRNTLAGGRRGGSLTALGVSTGQAVWALATSVGLAALLAASEPAFAALRLAGAGYLAFLGAQSILAAVRGDRGALPAREGDPARGRPRSTITAFYQGLISNLGNPKMAVFFLSLLPQFAPRDGASFAFLLGLGLVFCAMTLAWLLGYAAVVARAGDVLRRPRVRRALDATTGVVLVGLGARLAADSR
jgi:threonine/homoserine/homoserine lactone efflux protein